MTCIAFVFGSDLTTAGNPVSCSGASSSRRMLINYREEPGERYRLGEHAFRGRPGQFKTFSPAKRR